MSDWHRFPELPEIGRKFIALFDDGSGAGMFWRHDGGFVDQDGEEYAAEMSWVNYDRWVYLPDDLEFYCEIREDDPMTLQINRGPTDTRNISATAETANCTETPT